MRRLLVVAVLLTLAVPASAGAKPLPPDRCKRPGAGQLAVNPIAVVFKRRGGLYGCLRRAKRPRLLAEAYDDDHVTSRTWGSATLNGSFVAFRTAATDASCKAACPPDHDGVVTTIETVDLRTGRRRTSSYDGPLSWLGVSDTGAVAYLMAGGDLVVADGLGQRVLDRGAASAEVAESRLRWRSSGTPREALLAGGTTCQWHLGVTRAWDDVGRAYDRGPRGALFGCTWLRSRPRRLTTAPHEHVEMAGRFVAWSEPGAVVVHDLLYGREVRPPAGAVLDVALGGEGTVAWLQDDGRLLATRGTIPVELAAGAVEPGSLNVARGVVSWRQDDATRAASLPQT